MVAACQHSACPAFRACAVALLGSNKIDETIEVLREKVLEVEEGTAANHGGAR